MLAEILWPPPAGLLSESSLSTVGGSQLFSAKIFINTEFGKSSSIQWKVVFVAGMTTAEQCTIFREIMDVKHSRFHVSGLMNELQQLSITPK